MQLSRYITQSTFTTELLSIPYYSFQNFSTDLANLALNIDLPVINDISLDTLMNIRSDDGDAFHNFRIALQSKLKELRLINDSGILKKTLENIEHELLEVEVNEVNKKCRDIIHNLKLDALVFIGSLVTSYYFGGLTLVGVAGALLKSGVDYSKYLSEVKENNSYFLWKVKESAR